MLSNLNSKHSLRPVFLPEIGSGRGGAAASFIPRTAVDGFSIELFPVPIKFSNSLMRCMAWANLNSQCSFAIRISSSRGSFCFAVSEKNKIR